MKTTIRARSASALIIGMVCLGSVTANAVDYATVWQSGGTYYSNINKTSTQSHSTFTDAVIRAVGIGDRHVTIKCGGHMSKTVQLRQNTTVVTYKDRITKSTGYDGFYAYKSSNIKVDDLWMESDGYTCVRFSGCNNTSITDFTIRDGGAGIRVDSHSSTPWSYKVSGCTIKNINAAYMSGHAVETYGVDDAYVDRITAVETGGCGLLINYGADTSIGEIYGEENCQYGGGNDSGYYAAMRFANNCDGARVSEVTARRCGRGLFTTSGSKNITVSYVNIKDCTSHAILLENGSNNHVNGGYYNGVALITDCPNSSISATDLD